jgi:hypothetical protein
MSRTLNHNKFYVGIGASKRVTVMLRQISIGCLFAAILTTQSLAASVPNLLGMTSDKAIEAIRKAGLEPKQATNGKISLLPIGSVADQNPAAGQNVPAKTVVEFSLSSGVWVKNFVGASVESMTAEMEQTGLKFEAFDEQMSFVGKGIISSQAPSGAGFVDASTTVVGFGVATGPWISVPDLTGMPYGTAQSALKNLSLSSVVVSGPSQGGVLPPGGSKKGHGECLQTPWYPKVVAFQPPTGSLLFPGEQVQVWTQQVMQPELAVSEPCYCEGNGVNCIIK